MLWCLRVLIPAVPLMLLAALAWLVEAGRQVDFRQDSDLVFALNDGRSVGHAHLLAGGPGRQMETLLFDRLFRRDDELVIRGDLAESWGFRQRLVFYFTDQMEAEKAEALISAWSQAEKEAGRIGVSNNVQREGGTLSITFPVYERNNAVRMRAVLAELKILPVVKIRLALKDAAGESWEDFKKSAAEKGQIKRDWIEGNSAVILFVAGDVAQFLKELRFYYESNRNLEPEIEIVGDQSCLDVVEWVLTLKDGIRWHDDQPFSSKDVLFSFEEVMRPSSFAPQRDDFSHVASVRALDGQTILVECRDFYAPIAESWEKLPLLPSHLLEGAREADWESYYRKPVGTGGYVFESRQENGDMVLRRNKEFHLGIPRQERVVFRWVENHLDSIRWMRTGRIEGVWPSKARDRIWINDPRFQVVKDSYRHQILIAWNLKDDLLAQTEVRMALAHMIDVPGLRRKRNDHAERLVRGIFYPESWFCKKSMTLPERNPNKAASLLEQAGWRKEDGQWKNSVGEVFSFPMLVDQQSPDYRWLAEELKRQWAQNGIDLEIVPLPWSELVSDRLQQRDFTAALIGWELDFGRDQFRMWHSSEVEKGGGNIFGFQNRDADHLLEAMRIETEKGKIITMAEDLQELIRQQQPCMYLLERANLIVLRRGAVRLALPTGQQEWKDIDPVNSPAGLQNEWMWWSRKQEHQQGGSVE